MKADPRHEGSDPVIARARRKDPQAWAEIYEQFSAQLYGYFLHQARDRQAAEDLTSEVFLEALRAIDRFEGTLADLRSWLFSIGRHNLIDYFRKMRRTEITSIDTVDPVELSRSVGVDDPEETAVSGLTRDELLKAIQELSPDQREVLLLRLRGGLTSPEIAEIVGKTPGAVKALQHRALASLARILSSPFPLS